MPQVRTPVRQLVLDATNPSPADRIADVGEFARGFLEVMISLGFPSVPKYDVVTDHAELMQLASASSGWGRSHH